MVLFQPGYQFENIDKITVQAMQMYNIGIIFLNQVLYFFCRKKYKKVVFVYDYENPYVKDLDGFIYRELTDISDPLHIFVEDKSRGSDYGD